MAALTPESMTPFQKIFRCVGRQHSRMLKSCKGTTSCRMSALQSIIINLLIEKKRDKLLYEILNEDIIRELTGKIAKLDYTTTPDMDMSISDLKRILANESIHGTKIDTSDYFEDTRNHWFLGLVKHSQDPSVSYNIIAHYFYIKKEDDGFHIISTYGCDRVYMTQSDKVVTLEELQRFLTALETNSPAHDETVDSKQIISDFISTFFLDPSFYIEQKTNFENTGRHTTDLSLRGDEVNEYLYTKCWVEDFPIIGTLETIIDHELAQLKSEYRRSSTLKQTKKRVKTNLKRLEPVVSRSRAVYLLNSSKTQLQSHIKKTQRNKQKTERSKQNRRTKRQTLVSKRRNRKS